MKKTMLVWHCADTPPQFDVDIEDVRLWHLANDWTDVGYAGLIKRDGTIQKGRDLDGDGDVADEVGAHAAGFNTQSIGWCYAGGRGANGSPQYNPTPEQLASMKFITDETEVRFPGIETIGHCDLPGVTKSCPVFDVRAWRRTW
jgi:hypothetical protein